MFRPVTGEVDGLLREQSALPLPIDDLVDDPNLAAHGATLPWLKLHQGRREEGRADVGEGGYHFRGNPLAHRAFAQTTVASRLGWWPSSGPS